MRGRVDPGKAERGTARESPSWHMQHPSALSQCCFPSAFTDRSMKLSYRMIPHVPLVGYALNDSFLIARKD